MYLFIGFQFQVAPLEYGVIRDAAEAVKWYRLAAEQGDTMAQHHMGVSSRRDMPRDDHAANAWFLMAAAKGHVESVCEIGVSYAEATPPNYAAAFEWLDKAVAQGRYR